MISGFHDGLMITSNEDIVFYNDEIGSIFEVGFKDT
jgi:hypothetical protein